MYTVKPANKDHPWEERNALCSQVGFVRRVGY